MRFELGTGPRRGISARHESHRGSAFLLGLAIFFLGLLTAPAALRAQTIAADDFDGAGYTPGSAVPNGTGLPTAIDWSQTANANWLTTRALVDTTHVHSGTQAAYSDASSGSGLWGKFTAVTNARCGLYFYDDMGAVKNQYIFMDDSSGQYGMGVAVRTSQISGTFTKTSATKYMVLYALANPRTLDCVVTTIDRTVGWHKVEWIRDDNNTSVALDGVTLKLVPNSQMPDWASFDLGDWNWDHPAGNTPMWFDSALVKAGRTQSAYRWYQDNSAESPTALAAENTQTNAVPNTTYRLRVQVKNVDTNTTWAGDYLRLQYREGSNGGWTTMTTSSAKWKITSTTYAAGGSALTGILSGTTQAETHEASNYWLVQNNVSPLAKAEWDIPIVADATVVSGAQYDFRLVVADSAGTVIDTLTSYPALPGLIISAYTINRFTGTGNWSTTGNWSLGHAPTNSELAIISATATGNPVIDIAAPVAAGLRIEDGRTLSWSANNSTLTLNGPLVVTSAGIITQAGTNRAIVVTGASNPLFIEGTWTLTSTATNPVTVAGPTYLYGPMTNSANGTNLNFNGGLTVGNFGVLTCSGTSTFTTGGTAITVDTGGVLSINSTGTFSNLGDLTINSSGLLEIIAAANLSLTNNFVNNGSMVPRSGTASGNFNWASAAARSLTGSGATQVANLTNNGAGTLSLSPTGSLTVSTQLSAASGNISVAGPVTTAALAISAGRTVTAATGANLTVSGTTTLATGTLALTGGQTTFSGAFTLGGGTVDLQASGALNVSGTFTFTSGTLTTAAGSNLVVSGNFVQNAGAKSLDAASTVTFNGGANQTISGTGTMTWGNFTVNKSGGTLSSSIAITLGGDLSILAGTFNAGAAALTVPGTFMISGGTLTYTGTTIAVGAGWVNNGGTLPATVDITFNGTGVGTIGGSVTTTFRNMTFAKTGAGSVTITQDQTITGLLTSTSGTINAGTALFNLTGTGTIATYTGGTWGTGPNFTISGTQNTARTFAWAGNQINSMVCAFTRNTMTVNSNLNVTSLSFTGNGTTRLNNGGTYLLNVGAGGLSIQAGTLVQGGAVTCTGPFSMSGGTFTLAAGRTVTTGAFTLSGSTFTTSTGAITVNGDMTISGGTFTHSTAAVVTVNGNVTVSSAYNNSSSGQLVPTGDLTMATGGTLTNSSTAQTRPGGNLNISGGTFTLSAGTLAVGGDVVLTSGALTTTGGAFTVGTGWSNNGGTLSATLDVTFNGTGAGVISGSVATTFRNLTINKTGGSLTVSQDLTVTAVLTSTAGASLSGGTGTITLTGTGTVATRSGGTWSPGANLKFTGTTAQTLSWAGGQLGTLTMGKTSGTLTNAGAALNATAVVVNAAGTLAVGTGLALNVGAGGITLSSGVLTQGGVVTCTGPYTQSGGTYTATASAITTGDFTLSLGTFNMAANNLLTINGSFLQSGGTLTLPAAATNFNVSGGLVTNGGTLSNSATLTVNLSGSGIGNLGGTQTTTLGGLTMNKTGGIITCTGALDINGAATLTAGAIDPGTFSHAIQSNLTVGAGLSYSGANLLNVIEDAATASVLDIASGFSLGSLTLNRSANATATTFSRTTVFTGAVTITRGTLNLATNNPSITCGSVVLNGAAAANAVLTAGTGTITLNGDWTFSQGTLSGAPSVVSAANGTLSGLKSVWNNYTVNDAVVITQNSDLHTQGTFTLTGTADYTVSATRKLNTEGNVNLSGMLTFKDFAGGQWVSTAVDPTFTLAPATVLNLPGNNTFPATVSFVLGQACEINLDGTLTFNGSVTVNGAGVGWNNPAFTYVRGFIGGTCTVVFNGNVALHYVRFDNLSNAGGTATGVELGGASVATTVFDHVLFASGTSSAAASRFLTISGIGRDGATLADVGFFLDPGSPAPNTTIWRNSGTGSSAITVTSYLVSPVYVGGDTTDNDDGDAGGNNTDSNETLVVWSATEAPTPAGIKRLTAELARGQTRIEWETSTEHRLLGYRLYHSADGERWTRLDREMIPGSVESPMQHSYAFVTLPGELRVGDRVRLAEVTTDLKLRWLPRGICTVEPADAAGAARGWQWPTAWSQAGRWALRTGWQNWTSLAGAAHSAQTAAYGPQALGLPVRVLPAVQPVPAQGALKAGAQNSFSAEEWHKKAPPTPPSISPATGGGAAPAMRPIKFLSGEGLKITLKGNGVYALAGNALPPTAHWMLTPAGLRVAKLLDYDGQTRPLEYTQIGGKPAILFYGRGYEDAYTDRNVYWYGRFPNDPFKTATLDSQLRPTHGYYLAGSKFEYDGFYHFNEGGNLNEPNYYDDINYGLAENTTQSYSLTMDSPAAGTAYVRVALNSYTESTAVAPDHRVNVYVNGVLLTQVIFDGKGYRVLEVPFNAALLVNGANTVDLQTPAPVAGATYDRSLVDWVEVLYPRGYAAVNDELTVDVWGGDQLDVTGFTTSDIRVVDIGQIGRETLVKGAVYATGGGFGVKLTVGAQPTRLYFLTGAKIKAPEAVEYKTLATAHAAQANYAVVGTADRVALVEPLLTVRQGEGLSIARLDLDWAIEHYNYGRYGPNGVQDALRESQPQYALLLGDTVTDYKFQLHAATPVGLPAFFVQNRLQGRILTDAGYGDFDGDRLVDCAVGRLPARTLPDLSAMVTKIVAFTPPATDSALLVADNIDTQFGIDFKGSLDSVAAGIAPTTTTKVYRQDLASDAAARAAVIAAWNLNPTVVVFEGHASGSAWGDSRWFGSAPALAVSGQSTVLAATCHTAIYMEPTQASLGQVLMASPTGAISYIGSVAAANGPKESIYAENLTLALLGPSAPARIGDGMVQVSRNLISLDATMGDLVHSYVLLGDPAAPVKP